MAKKSIPVIDMEDGNVGLKMVKAFEEWGCFRLVNHGVAAELMTEMKAAARALTDLPLETKMRALYPDDPPRGYTAQHVGGPCYEGLNLCDVDMPGTIDDFCSLLDASSHQKEVLEKYSCALHDLTQSIGSKMMEGLGFEGDIFKNWACHLKLNKYNHTPETVGLASGLSHTDYGFLTIVQDDEAVNGLEAADKITGEFVQVDPMPGAFMINLGDIAEVWSNGRFHATKHRVLCHAPTIRTSIAYFALAPRGGKVEAPPEMVDSDHPRRYDPFDFEEFRLHRVALRLRSGEALEKFLAKTA